LQDCALFDAMSTRFHLVRACANYRVNRDNFSTLACFVA
jgi:hypothetical protein